MWKSVQQIVFYFFFFLFFLLLWELKSEVGFLTMFKLKCTHTSNCLFTTYSSDSQASKEQGSMNLQFSCKSRLTLGLHQIVFPEASWKIFALLLAWINKLHTLSESRPSFFFWIHHEANLLSSLESLPCCITSLLISISCLYFVLDVNLKIHFPLHDVKWCRSSTVQFVTFLWIQKMYIINNIVPCGRHRTVNISLAFILAIYNGQSEMDSKS